MSRALDGFASAMKDGYQFFGVSAIYTARESAPVQVSVMLDESISRFGEVATVAGKTVIVSVRTSEVQALPRAGDTFAVVSGLRSGKIYRVDAVVSSDELEHRVTAA